jgi:hypothetical protein
LKAASIMQEVAILLANTWISLDDVLHEVRRDTSAVADDTVAWVVLLVWPPSGKQANPRAARRYDAPGPAR